jgi:cyclic beta-1,2-glucan synthetase
VLQKFIPLCIQQGETERAERYKAISEEIVVNIEKEAWDGSWYKRAFFDDGTPLGSACNCECRIDSIVQSWAVISGAGKLSRAMEAMDAVQKYLVDREKGIIKLLMPPFDEGTLNPGYIRGYVPGARENGGQYTHAAAWVILAFAKLGMGNTAWELFDMVNPIRHSGSPIGASRYKPSLMCLRLMSMPSSPMRAEAGGHGIPARQAGCTEPG